MADAIFEVFRGNREGGQPATYRVPIAPGMVVLDALHYIQAHRRPISPCAGIARQANVARARQRSTVGLVLLAKPGWIRFPWTSPSRFTR